MLVDTRDLEQVGVDAIEPKLGSRLQAGITTLEHYLSRGRRPLIFEETYTHISASTRRFIFMPLLSSK
jgi:hypothetical protein